jgi:hypothetical protein
MEIIALTCVLSFVLVCLGIAFSRLSISLSSSKAHLDQNPVARYTEALLTDRLTKTLHPGSRNEWFGNFWQGIGTEVFGAAITALLLTVAIGVFEVASERSQLQEQLIRDMGSSDNGFALQAVDRLREEGWLTDGTLQNIG